MRLRMALAAGFLGGALAMLAAVGIITAVDGGGSDSPGGSVQEQTTAAATRTAGATPSDEPQTVAISEDCTTPADVYEAVRPAVVQISTVVVTDSPFGPQEGGGTGTGVVIDEDGYILTNNHVIDGARTIEVLFADGTVAEAELIGTDPADDLAVIQVDPAEADLTVAALGDSGELRVGDPVLAIGNPFGLEGTLTQGVVSGLDRTYSSGATTRPIRGMIQTDAPINPGNSGGPLLNCKGEVIGINTLLENPTGDNVNVGIGFAVSINTAQASLDDMIAGETVSHPWLGIAGADVTPAVVEQAQLDVDEGVYLTVVSPGSPADRAGLRGAFADEQAAASSDSVPPGGDVIIEADGEEVTGIEQLAAYLANSKDPGDTVELTIVRDGQELTITATLAEWPS